MSTAQHTPTPVTDTLVVFYEALDRDDIVDILQLPDFISSNVNECAKRFTYDDGYSPIQDSLNKGYPYQIEHGAFINQKWTRAVIAKAKGGAA